MSETLNEFQKHIVNNMYGFKVPADPFSARSILVTATPTPAFARVEFEWQGKKHLLTSLAYSEVGGDDPNARTQYYLSEFLTQKGFHIQRAPDLPLKRLAVRSGVAVYGRNNICYAEGMGSFMTLAAYYTDMPYSKDDWTDIRQADLCTDCTACLRNCPTHAIREDRFLIDNEKCLSYFNESPEAIPAWVPLSAFECVYDCLKCQIICPMNAPYTDHSIGPVVFDKKETDQIMDGGRFQHFEPALQTKLHALGMDKLMTVLPRNLRTLFEQTPHPVY